MPAAKHQAKGLKDGNGRAALGARQQRGASKADTIKSKQDLLMHLTRQAEENTKILERERAAVLAMEIQSVESQSLHQHPSAYTKQQPAPGRGMNPAPHGQYPHRSPPQQRQQRQPAGANFGKRQMLSPGPAGKANRSHMFFDEPKKEFDPTQVPGLGGAGPQQHESPPTSPFGGSEGARSPGLNGTFPDTPSFYPGMVFAVPVASPAPAREGWSEEQSTGRLEQGGRSKGQPGRQGINARKAQGGLPQQPTIPEDQTLRMNVPGVGPPTGQDMGHREMYADGPYGPMGTGMGQGVPAPMGMPGMGMPPPPPSSHGWVGPSPRGGAMSPYGGAMTAAQQRAEEEQRKAAYRRELDEQIRAKQQQKELERAARRKQEMDEAARLANEPPPWDPAARGRGRGGGGEPIRDTQGNQVADLRSYGKPGAGPPPPPPPYYAPQQDYTTGNQFGAGPARRSQPRLTVHVPNPAGQDVIPDQQGRMPGGHFMGPPGAALGQVPMVPQYMGPGAMTMLPPPDLPVGLGAPMGGPPPRSPMLQMGPGAGSPSGMMSPGGGPRRFMGALNELRAGPSDDQRRHADMQRRKLQQDLEEQIRQKKEREARLKAEEAAARAKEEAELQAYYARLEAQKKAEERAKRHSEGQEPLSAEPSQQWQAPSVPVQQQSSPSAHAGPVGKRRGAKKLIDASWLDNIPNNKQQEQAEQPGSFGAMPKHGRRATSSDGAGGGMRGNVRSSIEHVSFPMQGSPVAELEAVGSQVELSSMLQQLHQEQLRLREEFARQADAVEKLATEASTAIQERDKAWQELERVRAVLTDPESPNAKLPNGSDSLDQFVVSTHLVPRNQNIIPSRLSTPIEAAWAASRQPLLSPSRHKAPGLSSLAGGPLPVIYDSQDLDLLQDSLDQLMNLPVPAGHQGWGRKSNVTLAAITEGPAMYRPTAEERGLYRPISRLPGPPSQIPKPPPASMLHQAQAVPQSRYSSFFNLHAEMVPPQNQNYSNPGAAARVRQPLQGKPPGSPAILRGDLAPSPAKAREPSRFSNATNMQQGSRNQRQAPGRAEQGDDLRKPLRRGARLTDPPPQRPVLRAPRAGAISAHAGRGAGAARRGEED